MTAAWSGFFLVGLVPRTSRRLVDRMSGEGWRGWHVALAGVALATIGGLVAARGLPSDLWGWAFGSAAVPVVMLTAVLHHRIEVAWLAGPHGSWTPEAIQPWLVDVDGSAASAAEVGSDGSAAGRSTGARPRSPFRVRLAAADLDLHDVRRSTRLTRLETFVLKVAAVGAAGLGLMTAVDVLAGDGSLVPDSGLPPSPAERFCILLFLAVIALAACCATGANLADRVVINRRHNRLARSVNGFRPTWPTVAAIHGWRITRPGSVPHPQWRPLLAFRPWVARGVTGPPLAPPLVTLSGRIGDHEAWIVAGQRHCPLVCAVQLPAARLPLLVAHRRPVPGGDKLVWGSADEGFAQDLFDDEDVWTFLCGSLPSFAELILQDDAVALVTLAGIAPEPWRADAMVACLVGLVDRLPALGAHRSQTLD